MNLTTTGPTGTYPCGQARERAGECELDQACASTAVADAVAQVAIEVAVTGEIDRPALVALRELLATLDEVFTLYQELRHDPGPHRPR